MRTYTLHVTVELEDDDAARRAGSVALGAFVSQYGKARVHVTDADDWAEHVSSACGICGSAHPVDGRRNGTGFRLCREHPAVPDYPIIRVPL